MSTQLNPKRKSNSQNTKILEYLQDGLSLTPIEAYSKFKTMNLAQRIAQLRADGYDIKGKWIKGPNSVRFKEYYMVIK